MKSISALIVFFIVSTLTVSGQWSTTGNDIFNSNTGNVGIGAVPAFKLHIETPASDNDETLLKLGHRSSSVQVGTILEIGSSGYSTTGTSRIVGYSNPHVTLLSKIAFQTWNGSAWNNMLMDGSGNVGIGTTVPTERLTIAQAVGTGYSPLLSLNELTNNGNNSMGIDFKFAGLSGFPWGATGRVEVARQNTSSNFDMVFHTATNGVLSEKMRILDNGNIGIGKSAPNVNAKLDVNGNIYCNSKVFIGTPDASTVSQIAPYSLAVNGTAVFTKAKVSLYGNWPDYVFSPTYKMTSLDSLEQFIQLNKHLPEVPSASDVEKNGIDLGDNQALLLKKIEELTVFVIEQNKQSEKLQKIIKNQGKKNQVQSQKISELENKLKGLEEKINHHAAF